MSRYAVNKVLWTVARDDAQAAVYMETPEPFLAGFSLTDEERRQLLDRDFGAMFAAGAHPFLLHEGHPRYVHAALELIEKLLPLVGR